MGRLIDADALYERMTEEYKKYYAGTGKGEDFTIAMAMLQNTSTAYDVEKVVAEIRVKAIDEFVEAIVNYLKPFEKKEYTFASISSVEKLAQELKERKA